MTRTAIAVAALAAFLPTTSRADGWVEDGWPEDIVLQAEDCRLLAEHYPALDVTAAPFDAYGRPVAPADEQPVFRPPELRFLVEAPTIERGTWRSEPGLMELTIDLETGEISSRGKPVPGLTSTGLLKACNRNKRD
jgi:hypothetical protein